MLLPTFLAGMLVSCGERPGANPSAPPAPTTNASAAATTPKAQFESLKGKWLRADGDYVVEVRNVAADGKMEASYFNPNPINISRAAAVEDGGATKVFIELRDVNYPGWTYSLTYDPKNDQLFGTYFQASMQQTYDVAFARLKNE